jgi:hypothetical protein
MLLLYVFACMRSIHSFDDLCWPVVELVGHHFPGIRLCCEDNEHIFRSITFSLDDLNERS